MKMTKIEQKARDLNPRHIDLFFTIAALVGSLATLKATETSGVTESYRDPDVWAVSMAVVASVSVYWRRQYPLATLVTCAAPVVLMTALEYNTGALAFVVLLMTYNVGRYVVGKRTVAGLVIVWLSLALVAASAPPDLDARANIMNFVIFTAGWLMGHAVRSRREAEVAVLAEANERAEAERQEGARAVAEERLRIAQELHDVVAHSMSVIAVQAGVGAHVIDQQPDEAKKALEIISHTSRSTLDEMRRLLGVLRGDDGAKVYTPAPGLVDVPELIESVRAAGLQVEYSLTGDLEMVPTGIDLSVYRIVQESLTNVIKHAGRAVAAVAIECGDTDLALEVVDDGRGAGVGAANGGGHGLIGMRERVSVWGGSLTVGPRPGGGYRVQATIPYRPHPDSPSGESAPPYRPHPDSPSGESTPPYRSAP
jgi:signal transduction histidine kinase